MSSKEPSSSNFRKVILYIDDEPKNLSSFKSVFRRHYEVYLAKSASEGLDIMKQVPVQLVFADQRMPHTTGIEFLEHIKDEFPDVTRILITGYSDLDPIIDAINKGGVFKYIAKPWKADELKEIIESALEVAELKKQNKILMDSLQKTNHELDQFVYRAAHDIRGPIANLLGLINLSKIETNINLIQNYIHLKEQTVRRLDGFVHDIVDYSGNLRRLISKEVIVFKNIIENSIEAHKYMPKSINIDYTMSITQETDFISDTERIEILFNNLISNAIRFSVINRHEKSFVHITVESNDRHALIKISDNGEGIESCYWEKIFEMFCRASPNARDGSGLGLFICKEICEKLGGGISVTSEKDKGSVFTIIVPNLAS